MNIDKHDILYSCLSVNALSDIESSSRIYDNLLTWKFATLKSNYDKDYHYITLLDSKYLLYGKLSTSLIIGIFDLDTEKGCIFDEVFLNFSQCEFVAFKAQSVSEVNSILQAKNKNTKSFDEKAFEMLKDLSKVKENQAKSPDELAIKAIKLTLAFDKHLAGVKSMLSQ